MILQPILDIASICAKKSVNQVVISPGSRSAALTLAFARHPHIGTTVVPDERTAGFVALGMAQQLHQAVGVVCTSGSAAYNLAPAVVEAFFQEIPLVIFTADRPPEWIHQHDGQTMFQANLYGKHVKKAFDLPADYAHNDARWHIERVLNEAINTANEYPQGPIHINVPIREPFYPTADESWQYHDREVRVIERPKIEPALGNDTWHFVEETLKKTHKVLIAVGQLPPSDALWQTLEVISERYDIPVLGDVIANRPSAKPFITMHDVFLGKNFTKLHTDLHPELLITIGNSFISKNLKLFLRNHRPAQHWHVKPTEALIDTFQTLTHHLAVQPTCFFDKLLKNNSPKNENRGDFYEKWQNANQQASQHLNRFLDNQGRWSEFGVVRQLLRGLPSGAQLHLSNSMPVRYTNLVAELPTDTQIFANRGVSGIDGCTSTAVGAALQTNRLVFLLTGDVAFFYDRNALWHAHIPKNLRIILLNNAGGNIFRLIDGPSAQPELETYFETRHQSSAISTAQDAGLEYFSANNEADLAAHWPTFCTNDNACKLIEIHTDPAQNAEVFGDFRRG